MSSLIGLCFPITWPSSIEWDSDARLRCDNLHLVDLLLTKKKHLVDQLMTSSKAQSLLPNMARKLLELFYFIFIHGLKKRKNYGLTMETPLESTSRANWITTKLNYILNQILYIFYIITKNYTL